MSAVASVDLEFIQGPMIKFSRFTLLLILCCIAARALAQERIAIYDGRSQPKTATPTKADLALVKRDSLPKARRLWRNDDGCKEDFQPIGGAVGSFTTQNAQQRAILYRFCETGHDFANNGIVIIEGNSVVSQVLYSGGADYDISAASDLDGDGLFEIVLGDGSTHQGYTNAVATVIGLSANNVKKFGIADVYEDDCGVSENCKQRAYLVYALVGIKPVFMRETYAKRNGRWIRIAVGTKYLLRADETEYKLVR